MSTNDELIEALTKEREALLEQISLLRTEVRGGKKQSDLEQIEKALAVLEDPFDSQNARKIIGEIPPDEECPEGQVLRWVSPRYREVRGLRGWEPLQWGDQYTGEKGEKLKGIIPEVPRFIQGADHLDSYVRSGDVILARLDKRIWNARQTKRVLEDARRKGQLNVTEPIRLREGVYLTGDGIKTDSEPTFRKSPSDPAAPFDPESGEGAHRTQLTTPE